MASKSTNLQNRLMALPDFVFDFVRKYYDGESINTQLAYCIDIKVFFTYLKSLPGFRYISKLEDVTPAELEKVDLNTLLDYKVYLENYQMTYAAPDGREVTVTLKNGPKGVLRKLATLRTLYGYLFKADLISKNITEKLDLPKIKHRLKKPLSTQDTINIIDVIFNGEKYFEGKHLSGYEKKKVRDIAMFVTLLGTGIRVSELIGMNLDDLDFENNSFIIKRKGGEHQEIYMPVQVANELYAYTELRMQQKNAEDKDALFLSNRRTRMTVSSVEKMIQKYCETAGITHKDKMTVHALRRTFACQLIEDGVDLKLVAELMGHKDISVTAKFYAQHNKATHKKVMNERQLPIQSGAI